MNSYFFIVADRGNLKAYRAEEAPAGRSPRVKLVEAISLVEDRPLKVRRRCKGPLVRFFPVQNVLDVFGQLFCATPVFFDIVMPLSDRVSLDGLPRARSSLSWERAGFIGKNFARGEMRSHGA
jgi:hypothetical protein